MKRGVIIEILSLCVAFVIVGAIAVLLVTMVASKDCKASEYSPRAINLGFAGISMESDHKRELPLASLILDWKYITFYHVSSLIGKDTDRGFNTLTVGKKWRPLKSVQFSIEAGVMDDWRQIGRDNPVWQFSARGLFAPKLNFDFRYTQAFSKVYSNATITYAYKWR